MPKKKQSNKLLQWLLALNLVLLTIIGAKQLYVAYREKQERHQRAVAAATIITRSGTLNHSDATKMMELADSLEHGASISNADLNWFLGQLKNNSGQRAAARRNQLTNVLRIAVMRNTLTRPQRERLVQAMVARLAMDDPRYELGTDVADVALVMAEMKDTRAISLLRPYLNDPRPTVRRAVRTAFTNLERKEAQ